MSRRRLLPSALLALTSVLAFAGFASSAAAQGSDSVAMFAGATGCAVTPGTGVGGGLILLGVLVIALARRGERSVQPSPT